MKKSSDAVDKKVVKKTKFKTMEFKVNKLDNKISDATTPYLVKNSDFDTNRFSIEAEVKVEQDKIVKLQIYDLSYLLCKKTFWWSCLLISQH